MFRHFVFAAVLVVALLLIGSATPVAAQANTTVSNGTAEQDTEMIDANTVLLEASYDSETDLASVTIRSETLQQVTISDAGAFMEGGKIAQRSATLRPDETATIKIPATKVKGFIGISVATPNTMHAVPLEVSTPLFPEPATWQVVQVAGATGFAGGFIALLLVSYVRVRGNSSEVEQVA